MSGKWGTFAIGLLAGMVVILGGVLLLDRGAGLPDLAAQGGQYAGGESATGELVMTGVGGSGSDTFDYFYVLQVDPQKDEKTGRNRKYLAVYQVRNMEKLRLVGSREITWDLQLPEYKNEKPSVKEIMKGVVEAEERRRAGKEPVEGE